MKCVRSLDCINNFFGNNRVSFEHFFSIFCKKNILSVKLFLRGECDDNLFKNDKKIGQFYRLRRKCTFTNLLCCSAAYMCDCENLSIVRAYVIVNDF